MPSINYAYVNGRFVPEAKATVSIFDRGFLYGDGCFETMRLYNGRLFRAFEHMERLAHGLNHLGIESPLSGEELRAVCRVLTERNAVREGMTRIYVTSGVGNHGLVPSLAVSASVVIVTQPREFKPLTLQAIIASTPLDKTLSGLKTANRLPYVLARREAERAQASEAILVNAAGHVVEFTTANLFAVKNGSVWTPPLNDGPLPGITRHAVLVLAHELEIPVGEKSFDVEFLEQADEIFATNSLIEIAPVERLAGRKLPSQATAARLISAYQRLVHAETGK